MKKAVKQIFILPVLSFLLTLVLFLLLFNVLLNNIAEKKFIQEKEHLIKIKKDFLKNEVDSIVLGVDQLREVGYSLAYKEIDKLMELIVKQKPYKIMGMQLFIKKHLTKDLFYWYKTTDYEYPSGIKKSILKIGDKTYNIVIFNNRKYLVTSRKFQNGEFGVAYSLKIIQKTIKKNIFKFLDRINKNKSSYIAMGKILTWHPGKDGVFGKIIYIPETMKKFIGKKLSINIPDKKGKYYRKIYFEAFKNGKDSIYIEYCFKNPKTNEYESKISYFKIYRPYNWVIVKGFYHSQIEKIVNNSKKQIIKNVTKLFYMTVILLLLIALGNVIAAYIVSKKIMKFVFSEYDTLKNNYENAQKELLNKVYYDPLTKLPNRYKLFEEIGQFESLCVVDIDDFSYLNDIYGFETGNDILCYLAEYLKKRFENVYRIGSDEFAIGFKRRVSSDEIKNLINSNLFYNDIKINLSAGVSYLKDKLFETAETALKFAYKDKNIKYKIYNENIQLIQKERIKKIQQLSKILEREAVIPYYQCIVNSNGEVVKYEALMRVQYENQIYTPFQFMDIIKEAKLYSRFSRLMIKKVFNDLKNFSVPVSINLSFADITDRVTRELVLEMLKMNGINCIIFEILETENIEQFDIVYDFINEVKKYGAKIAIDDFGSGYSNLVNILNLHPDYLKIDASLVKNLDNQMYSDVIKFIVVFAKKFNIKTTAEFVSDEEKFFILKNLGIDEFQGFYFCKPQPISDVI